MSHDCTDKRFQKMLHLYELNLLSETDRQQFEEHLFECDHCFDAVSRFADVTRHLSRSPRVRKAIEEMISFSIDK